MKLTSTLLCLSLAIGNQANTQTVKFLSAFDSDLNPLAKFSLIGKFSENYLVVYGELDPAYKLLIYDKEGKKIGEKTYDFLNKKSIIFKHPKSAQKTFYVINQKADGDMRYTELATLDGNGELIKDTKLTDTSSFYYVNWKSYDEPNGEYFLLYRTMKSANSRLYVDYVLIDKFGNSAGIKNLSVPFDENFEKLDNVFVSPNGTVYFAIHDQALNYRLGSKLRLYKTQLKDAQPVETEIYLKENKPVELAFAADPDNQFIAFGGLYANFYTHTIEGAMTLIYNTSTNRADDIIYMPFDKGFKKELKAGISSIPIEDLINKTVLQYLQVNADKSVSMVADLIAKRLNASRPALTSYGVNRNSYWDGSSNSFVTPSQSFDQIRTDIATRQLPPVNNGTGLGMAFSAGAASTYFQASNMPDWNRHIADLQTDNLTNPYYREVSSAYYRDMYAFPIAANRMVRKSLVFTVNSYHKKYWKTLVPDFYLPNTPFTNLTTIQFGKNISLINYEVASKTEIFLEQKSFSPDGKLIKQVVCAPGLPVLFHKGQSIRLSESEMLTLYSDPLTGRAGLAIINW